LFRIDTCRWVIALPELESELDAYESRIQQEWSDANRNRPFGPLPEVELRSAGTWKPRIHEEEIVACLQQLLKPLEASSV